MDGAVVDELQQQVADVLERHGPVAEVHVGRRGDAGDGVAVGLVRTVLPFTLTLTIAAFMCCSAIVCRTICRIASACAELFFAAG